MATTLDPAKKSTFITLSNGNRTATRSTGTPYFTTVLSTKSGAVVSELYVEVTGATESGIGVSNAMIADSNPTGDTNWLGWDTNSIAVYGNAVWHNNVNVGNMTSVPAVNDVIAVDVNRLTRQIWFRNVTKNEAWWPSDAVGYSIASIGDGNLYLGLSLITPEVKTVNFDGTFIGPVDADAYRWDGVPVFPDHYILSAAKGTLVAAGQAATLRRTRKLPALNGVLTASGWPTTLARSRKLPAVNGILALSGRAAALRSGRRLPAVTGTLTLTGYMAGLVTTGSYQITANTGVLALTGTVTGLRFAHRLLSAQGAILLTGKTAALVYTPAVTGGYTLTAASGVLALSGRSAELRIDRVLPPLFVQTATLNFGRRQRSLLGPWRAD